MIKYSLSCKDGHEFDSWFASSADYDRLAGSGMLSCAVCGGARVEKALMAPRVSASDTSAQATRPPRPLGGPATPAEQALRALREKVEREAENVGRNFTREARAIQAGEAPERPIWGEARVSDARKLAEDGIPVAPLPFPMKPRN